ncbi:MAG: hypothetical protein K940chlam5_00417 [Candidatus Anoxychlamydiales bacterium]|nr:hypothetical protein [Candidatus Anoxychlamydiales bacterium]
MKKSGNAITVEEYIHQLYNNGYKCPDCGSRDAKPKHY